MPRAKFTDANITLSLNRKYPHMLVGLLDNNNNGQGYLGPGSRLEHFTGEVEAINVKWDSWDHSSPAQAIEIAESVDFDAGIGITLKMDGECPCPIN